MKVECPPFLEATFPLRYPCVALWIQVPGGMALKRKDFLAP